MYGRQPLNDLQLLTCPKCGAPQESPGSTVCELCGADLPHPGVKRPATPHSALRLKHFLRGPVRLLTRGVSAMQLFVLFAVRATTFLLLLTSLVVGSSLIPAVNALIPVTHKLTPGTYKVTFSRPGYRSASRTITVERGKAASLGVNLARERPSPPRPTPPSGQSRGMKKHDSKRDGEP